MTRPDGPGSLSPRRTSWPAWRGAVLSLLLHGAVVALLLSGRLELGEPLPESPPTPVEIIFGAEPEQQAQAEPAPPDPPAPDTAEVEPQPEPPVEEPAEEPDVAEPAEAEPQPDLAIEEAAEEPDVAEPAEPDPAGREAAEAEPQPEAPIEASTEEPDVAEASDRPGPEPETAEEIEPEAAPLPELAEAPIPKLRPEIAAPALPPLPLRKPDLAQALEPEQPEAPTTPEPDTAGEEPGPPRPAYTSRDQVGAVTPQALLANLAELRDEAAQARRNPALWEVIRAVRAQMRRCWQYGPEERIDPKLSVDIRVAFERSGAVRKAEVQEVSRMVQDEAYMNFAKRAHRALMACSPFELPGDHYAVWQAFTLRFVLRQPS